LVIFHQGIFFYSQRMNGLERKQARDSEKAQGCAVSLWTRLGMSEHEVSDWRASPAGVVLLKPLMFSSEVFL